MVRNSTMGEANFNIFFEASKSASCRIRKNFIAEENLSPVQIPTEAKVVDELKLANTIVDVVERANRKNSLILLQYNVDKT